MRLFIRGDGLLGTHVTLKDITDCLRQNYPQATSDPEIVGEPKRIGEANGLQSRICVADVNWNSTDPSLPTKVVIKIPSMLANMDKMMDMTKNLFLPLRWLCRAFVAMLLKAAGAFNLKAVTGIEDIIKKSHNHEVDFYSHVKKSGDGRLKMLDMHCAVKFDEQCKDKGFFLMEYVPKETIAPCHYFEDMGEETFLDLLKTAATLHSLGSIYTSDERKEREILYFTGLMAPATEAPDMMLNMFMKSLAKEMGSKEELDRLKPILMKLKQKENLKNMDALTENLGMTPTPTHGDFWMSNVIFTKQPGEDMPKLRAVIDFQGFHFGNPAADITRLFITGLTPKMRRERWLEFIDIYYEHLTKECQGGQLPFKKNDLILCYMFYFPLASFYNAIHKAGMIDYELAQVAPEEMEQERERIRNNIRGLLTDAVDFFNQVTDESWREKQITEFGVPRDLPCFKTFNRADVKL